MKIINYSKKTTVSSESKQALSFYDRSVGLLDQKNPRTMVFNTHFGLHTFGLTSPIDIIVLNNQHEVVKLGKNIPPNRFFFYNPVFDTVIELPAGTVDVSRTTLNDKIKFA